MDQPKEFIEQCVSAANTAFQFLKQTTIQQRADFMFAVADKIESLGQELLDVAHEETALPMPRLKGEKARTVGQWRSYGKAVASGIYSEARIDLADASKGKGDLRKYNVGIGPVVVFGASNFPFAFSTAGGDTASAIGAGCPVIVKGHPGHPKTSQLMADTVLATVEAFGWPQGVFSHLLGDKVAGTETLLGAYLTVHPSIKAVGFTGSFAGGKALFDLANQREEPIPVFAEMGSVNPVFALAEKMNTDAESLAKEYAASLTLGVGQFCTNPGLFVAVKGPSLERFKAALSDAIAAVSPVKMLHQGIYQLFEKNKVALSAQSGVSALGEAQEEAQSGEGRAKVVATSAKEFLTNPALSEEVFGPFGVLVEAEDVQELLAVATQLKGQLTVTIAATVGDMAASIDLLRIVQDKAGRLLFNGMPTGVEVVYAMQHGGPYPATTDARFTSVGPDAVKRFVRPVSFQNWPQEFLPVELRDDNVLGISRVVDNVATQGQVEHV